MAASHGQFYLPGKSKLQIKAKKKSPKQHSLIKIFKSSPFGTQWTKLKTRYSVTILGYIYRL